VFENIVHAIDSLEDLIAESCDDRMVSYRGWRKRALDQFKEDNHQYVIQTAYNVATLSIASTKQQIINVQGDLVRDKQEVKLSGTGNTAITNQNASFNDIVTNHTAYLESSSIEDGLKQAINDAMSELSGLSISEPDKADIADNLEKVTKAVESNDKSMIQRYWERILQVVNAVGAAAPAFIKLGAMIGPLFS